MKLSRPSVAATQEFQGRVFAQPAGKLRVHAGYRLEKQAYQLDSRHMARLPIQQSPSH